MTQLVQIVRHKKLINSQYGTQLVRKDITVWILFIIGELKVRFLSIFIGPSQIEKEWYENNFKKLPTNKSFQE